LNNCSKRPLSQGKLATGPLSGLPSLVMMENYMGSATMVSSMSTMWKLGKERIPSSDLAMKLIGEDLLVLGFTGI